MVALEVFWSTNEDWYYRDAETSRYVIKDDAPQEAKESFNKYCKQLEDIDKRTSRSLIIPKTQKGIDFYEKYDPDWLRGSHETEDLIVYNIPYEEFCIIRKEADLETFLYDNNLELMQKEDVEKYIKLLTDKNLEVPETVEILHRAVFYNTYVDYVESHIL